MSWKEREADFDWTEWNNEVMDLLKEYEGDRNKLVNLLEVHKIESKRATGKDCFECGKVELEIERAISKLSVPKLHVA